jgi:hypothetical protein
MRHASSAAHRAAVRFASRGLHNNVGQTGFVAPTCMSENGECAAMQRA